MPAFASLTTLRAARQRSVEVNAAHYAGRITLAGRTYPCSLDLGAVEPSFDAHSGSAFLAQRGTAHVEKTRLATAPARDTVLVVNGVEFKVESVTAALHEPVWVIKFYRLPPAP